MNVADGRMQGPENQPENWQDRSRSVCHRISCNLLMGVSLVHGSGAAGDPVSPLAQAVTYRCVSTQTAGQAHQVAPSCRGAAWARSLSDETEGCMGGHGCGKPAYNPAPQSAGMPLVISLQSAALRVRMWNPQPARASGRCLGPVQ